MAPQERRVCNRGVPARTALDGDRFTPPMPVTPLTPAPRRPVSDGDEPAWTADRLGALAQASFPGQRVVVLGRAPGQRPSGVVTALEPVASACQASWIAPAAGDDAFARAAIEPLCHRAHVKPAFRLEDLQAYQRANRRVADAVASGPGAAPPVVLIEGVPLALTPQLLRQRLPGATTVCFWHVPWPTAQRFEICPWPAALLEGLLGSSVLGFQTTRDARNFLDTVQHTLEAEVDRAASTVTWHGRRVHVGVYPTSIAWPNPVVAQLPAVADRARALRARLGIPDGAVLAAGVDRLDFTKGLEEKILGVERLLESRPSLRGRFVLVQVTPPPIETSAAMRDLGERLRAAVGRVNGRFGDRGQRPVVLIEEVWSAAEVAALLRAADVCCVSSLHDGMNLVAKEFASVRDDERGVLVLSTFTGAARELPDALLVNPYDAADLAGALARAAFMPVEEQRARMTRLRGLVAYHNAYRWAARLLAEAWQARLDEQREAPAEWRLAAR
jgi:trehalose 6-phosphate synthase